MKKVKEIYLKDDDDCRGVVRFVEPVKTQVSKRQFKRRVFYKSKVTWSD